MQKDDFVGAEVFDEEEGLDEESDTVAGRDLCSYISNKLRFLIPMKIFLQSWIPFLMFREKDSYCQSTGLNNITLLISKSVNESSQWLGQTQRSERVMSHSETLEMEFNWVNKILKENESSTTCDADEGLFSTSRKI